MSLFNPAHEKPRYVVFKGGRFIVFGEGAVGGVPALLCGSGSSSFWIRREDATFVKPGTEAWDALG